MSVISTRDAVKTMRDYSDNQIPFSFSFISHNATTGASSGVKHVKKAQLRRGYSSKHSNKSDSIIAYKDLQSGKPRNCYLPLIIKFNDKWLE